MSLEYGTGAIYTDGRNLVKQNWLPQVQDLSVVLSAFSTGSGQAQPRYGEFTTARTLPLSCLKAHDCMLYRLFTSIKLTQRRKGIVLEINGIDAMDAHIQRTGGFWT